MATLKQIIAIAAEGCSARQIADRLGVSTGTITTTVNRAGLSLRSLNGGQGYDREARSERMKAMWAAVRNQPTV